MENYNADNTVQYEANYYKLTRHYLQKQYSKMSEKEIGILSREAIFAPSDYKIEIDQKPVSITAVRQNLADFIERDTSASNFIPYSLDASIADLIEQSSCETSSMNEYYRWISATAEILRHTGDNNVTHKDLDERDGFLKMSYDREAEILLCLALYQGANNPENKNKIDMLRFKLARLRDMRSIVSNTSSRTKRKIRPTKEMIEKYREYLKKISQEINISFDIAAILKLNSNQSDYDDLDEKYSHFKHVQAYILYRMRVYELSDEGRSTTKTITNTKDSNSQELALSNIRSASSLSRDTL